MVSADCELASIFRNIGQRISPERLRRALPRLPGAGRQGPRAASPGAIVKGEHGLPVRARSYGNWFRDIARAAGIRVAVFVI
jgi:hypothetical protein